MGYKKQSLLMSLVVLAALSFLNVTTAAQQKRPIKKAAVPSTLVTSSTEPPVSSSTLLSPTTTLVTAKANMQPLGVPDNSPTLPEGSSWTSMFGAFLFVLSLAALGAMGVSYWMRGKLWPWPLKRFGLRAPVQRPIQVLESIPLGQRRYLTVIDIAGEKHLLGLSPGGISYLTRLSAEAAAAYAAAPKANGESYVEEILPERKRPFPRSPLESETSSAEPKQIPASGTFEEEYRKLKSRLSGK